MEKEGVLFLIASLCVLISYYMRLYDYKKRDYKKVNYLDNNLISIVSNLLALTSVMLYLEVVRELIKNEIITNSFFFNPRDKTCCSIGNSCIFDINLPKLFSIYFS